MKSLGEKLMDILEQKDMTQRNLADLVGVTEVTISRYINGSRQPRSDILGKIAKALNVSLDDLLNTSTIDASHIVPKNNKLEYQQFMDNVKVYFMNADAEDKDAIFKDISDIYFESKQINKKKYSSHKKK